MRLVRSSSDFVFPIRAVGNHDLRAGDADGVSSLAIRGWSMDRVNVTASVYWNNTKTGSTSRRSCSTRRRIRHRLAGPCRRVCIRATADTLPAQYTYLNFGTVKDKGIELGVDTSLNRYLNVFANYSYQWKPVVRDSARGTSIIDINWPAENRFNAGFDFSYARFLGNLSVNYTDEAYWQDVLDLRYAGTTEAFTLVNGTVRRALAQRHGDDERQGHEPGEPGSAAAHLRRRPEASGGGGAAVCLLTSPKSESRVPSPGARIRDL